MEPRWTALFYIYAEDVATQKYAKELETLLLSVKHTENLQLLLFRSMYSPVSDEITGELFQLRSSGDNPLRRMVSLRQFLQADPGDQGLLESVLLFIKNAGHLKGRFMFLPWDHGAGFGIFNATPWEHMVYAYAHLSAGKMNDLKIILSRLQIISSKRHHSFIGTNKSHFQMAGVAAGATGKTDMLTMTEINLALRVLGFKTSLVIMLNCWTQMLETGFEFMSTVEWLVAPETVHYFKGYDYLRILNAIADDIDITAEELAAIAVNTLKAYFEANTSWTYALQELVVSAAEPAKSKDVMAALSSICDKYLIHQITSDFHGLMNIRRACYDLSTGIYTSNYLFKFIDLLGFITILTQKGIVGQQDYHLLRNAVNNYVKYLHIPQNSPQMGMLSGFSIFHPDESDDFGERTYYDYFYRQENFKMAYVEEYIQWANYLAQYGAGL